MAGRRTDAGGVLLESASLNATTAAKAALDRPFSLYLDLVRTLAACAVVMAHFGYFRIFDDAQIARIADLGREAVIAYSAEQRNRTLGDYASARCARPGSTSLSTCCSWANCGVSSKRRPGWRPTGR